MELIQERFQETKNHTKSLFKINGEFKCFILEDGFNKEKVYGETRIPAGEYDVELRTSGGMNEKYLKKFGSEFHHGMLWIKDVPNYEYIYIHIGNTPENTLGCPLTGFVADSTKNEIGSSRLAYEAIYPTISEAIMKGENVIIKIT